MGAVIYNSDENYRKGIFQVARQQSVELKKNNQQSGNVSWL